MSRHEPGCGRRLAQSRRLPAQTGPGRAKAGTALLRARDTGAKGTGPMAELSFGREEAIERIVIRNQMLAGNDPPSGYSPQHGQPLVEVRAI